MLTYLDMLGPQQQVEVNHLDFLFVTNKISFYV